MNELTLEQLENALENSEGNKRIEILLAMIEKVIASDYDRAISLANEAMSLAKEYDHKTHQAQIRSVLGSIKIRKGEFAQALMNYLASLEIYEALGDKMGEAIVLGFVGNAFFYSQKPHEAIANYKKAMEIHQELGNNDDVATLANKISSIFLMLELYDDAQSYAEKSLSLRKASGNNLAMASSYHTLGTIYQKKGELDKSLENFNHAQIIRTQNKDEVNLSKTLYHIAEVFLAMGRNQKALEAARKSYEIAYRLKRTKQVIDCMTLIGEIFTITTDYEQAESYLSNALVNAQKMNMNDTADKIQTLLSKIQADKQSKAEPEKDIADDSQLSDRSDEPDEAEQIEKAADEEIPTEADTAPDTKAPEVKAQKTEIDETEVDTDMDFLRDIIDLIDDVIIYKSDDLLFFNKTAENLITEDTDDDDAKFDKIEEFYNQIKDKGDKVELQEKSISGDIYRIALDSERDWLFQVTLEDIGHGNLLIARDITHILSEIDRFGSERKAMQDDIAELTRKNNSLKEILFHVEEEKIYHKKNLADRMFRTIVPLLTQIQNDLRSGKADEKSTIGLIENLKKDISSVFEEAGYIQDIYANLSSREIEVSNLIRNGLTSKEIAETLGISVATVNRHRNSIRDKLNLVDKKQSLKNYLRNKQK